MNDMTCAQARKLMLDADIDELTGTVDSPLARHIAGCASCAAVARALMEAYGELDAGLAQLATARSSTGALPFRKRRLVWGALPLAAAAIIALVMVNRENAHVPPPPTMLAKLMFPEQAVVTPPAGRQAVVIERPDLTVVWLY